MRFLGKSVSASSWAERPTHRRRPEDPCGDTTLKCLRVGYTRLSSMQCRASLIEHHLRKASRGAAHFENQPHCLRFISPGLTFMRMRVLLPTTRTKREGPPWEPSRPKPVQPRQVVHSRPVGNTAVGFLLTDANLKPLYANGTAVGILQYAPSLSPGQPGLQERLRSILQTKCFELEPSPTAFLSG